MSRTNASRITTVSVDRLLQSVRQPHRLTTAKPGRLLKQHIPARTFTEWTDVQPGLVEADLVAHCGGSMEGAFLYTLTLTDVTTTWTECLPLLHRTQHGVVRANEQLTFTRGRVANKNDQSYVEKKNELFCKAVGLDGHCPERNRPILLSDLLE